MLGIRIFSTPIAGTKQAYLWLTIFPESMLCIWPDQNVVRGVVGRLEPLTCSRGHAGA